MKNSSLYDQIHSKSVLENENNSLSVKRNNSLSNMTIEGIEIKINSRIYREPPDGGLRAWCVMISAFICVGLIFGVINTYSILYVYIQDSLTVDGEEGASGKAALVGSLTIGMTFLLSPVSGILTDKIGLRKTTLIGGILTTSGMLIASFFAQNIYVLYITYGIMYGLGAALAYTPSIAILGHYFKKRIGIVNGIVASGSSVFTVLMPLLLQYLLKRKSVSYTLRVLAVMSSFIIFCALVYKPLYGIDFDCSSNNLNKSEKQECRRSESRKPLIHKGNLKNKQYLIWSTSFAIALFGYFVPYVHIAKLIKIEFPQSDENLPIMCLGITSGISRIVFGLIADYQKVNRILLQQFAIASMGIATMFITTTNSYFVIIVFFLAMGVFDGCFITMIGPIAFDLCEQSGATQAIGFLFGLCSIPLTIGPPIAGLIYDQTKSYTLPFVLSGISPLFSACLMFMIRCTERNSEEDISKYCKNDNEINSSISSCQNALHRPKLSSSVNIATPTATRISSRSVASNAKSALYDLWSERSSLINHKPRLSSSLINPGVERQYKYSLL